MSTGTAPRPSWWAHLRGALLALHILAICLVSLPAPEGGMDRGAWSDPTVQAELLAWRDRLARVGLDLEAEVLEDHLWDFAQGYMSTREATLGRLDPYFRHLGTRQSWRMFVAPHRNPAKLVVAVRTGGTWEVVYRSRDPEAAWRDHQLDHTRTRSAIFRYAWKHYRRPYARFARWLAREAASDFPEADRIRVYWWRYRTLSPEAVRAGEVPEGAVERPRELDLDGVRADLAEEAGADRAEARP